MKIDNSTFSVSDLITAAYISYLEEYPLISIDRSTEHRDGRCRFVFEVSDSEKFFQCLDLFHRGEARVCPKLYYFHLKQVRNRLRNEK